jgi:amidase
MGLDTINQDRPSFGSPGGLSIPKLSQLKGWDVVEINISTLQGHFAERHFSSVEYVSHCIDYIRVLNPFLEAVIEVNPDAITIAERLDSERASGLSRGLLHGVPILTKDNIATKDKMHTTAGSWALLGSIVPKDAFVVSRLREAGAIILGHTNMCEWAAVRSRRCSAGYSPRGGQSRNPFNLRKSAFGSSSGSAAAVSANFVPIAIGTETDTSIIGPADYTGVVGIKPTVGLTSRSGVVPISENLDTVGSFGRTVVDAVAVLDVIAAKDEEDLFTLCPERKQPGSYSSFLSKRESLYGARFGLPMKKCWQMLPEKHRELASKFIDAIKEAGAEIIEVELPSIDERIDEEGNWDWEHGEADKSEWTVGKVDGYNAINAYLRGLVESQVRSVEDIVAFNQKNDGTEGGYPGSTPAFPDGQAYLLEMLEQRGVKDETYYKALKHIQYQTRQNGIDAALSYLHPSTGVTSQLDTLIFCDRRHIGQQYAAQAGYPIICIPIGVDIDGMPVSISLQHTAWKEAELIKWASAIEDLWREVHGPRVMPTFKNLGAKNMPIEDI